MASLMYEARKHYYATRNNRITEGRKIAKQLDAIRTQQQVANILHVSRSYVDQLEIQALYKISIILRLLKEKL